MVNLIIGHFDGLTNYEPSACNKCVSRANLALLVLPRGTLQLGLYRLLKPSKPFLGG